MTGNNKDLRSYLNLLGDRLNVIRKPVDVATQAPALCSQSTSPLLFSNLAGFDGWQLVDRLLGDRGLQALALDCAPDVVIPHYAALSAAGSGALSAA